jgi:hypothetical protein
MNRHGQLMEKVRGRLLPAESGMAEAAVEALWQSLLPGRVLAPATKTVLVDYVEKETPPSRIRWANKLPGLLTLIMGTPDYQLC